MAKPSKKKGFRAINIENIQFNWCFGGIIDVRPDQHKGNSLTIDFGWFDVWDYIHEIEPPEFEPKVVGPKFVSDSIKFAINNGWNPELSHHSFKLIYRDKKYKVMD